MKKITALVLAIVMVFALCAMSGCGGDTAKTNSISVCIGSEPDTIDPALNSAIDGATLCIHAFSGLVGYTKNASGALELVPNCATSIPEGVTGADGKVTYTFTLKDGLKWSDGSAVTAEDFVYSWNRAVSPDTGADYGYMFDVIDGYDEAAEGSGKLNVTAKDEKTIEIVLKNYVPYFIELLAFPTYLPVKKDVVEANPDGWATDPATYICNGPFVMKEWVHDSKIVYAKNPNYHDADKIKLDEINFYLSDDANNMLANFKTKTWDFIDDVPTSEIAALEKDYPNEYYVSGQLGTYYVCFNVNESILPSDTTLTGEEAEAAEEEIRLALGLILDRNYICEEIGQAGQVPASTFVGMGLTDADGKTEFIDNAGHNDGYRGYFRVDKDSFESNCAEAVEVFKKYYNYDEAAGKFTNFPAMTYLYNTNDSHKAIGEYIQSAFAVYGINITLENQEWNTFLNTRKNGDYTIARNGWLSDYNDPMSFLDMWITNSGNNDAQYGKGDHGTLKMFDMDLTDLGIDYKVEDGTWAETYDYTIGLAKTETNVETRFALMHKAEDLLMTTGGIVPLYYYTDNYMSSTSLKGFFASPLGYKYFMYVTK